MSSLTSREFNQDTARAKREAAKGPVFITDRGKTTHVLLSVEEFKRINTRKQTVAEAFYWPGAGDADLESVLPERRVEPEREINWDDA